MQLRPHQVDQRDLQGNILTGYGNDFRHGLYLFVHVNDARAGREWLRDLAGNVTTAVPWRPIGTKPQQTLNVALTYEGLRAIGLPKAIARLFPKAFRRKMANRNELLGDTGPNAPKHWDPGLRKGEPHLLVTVTAQDPGTLRWARTALYDRIASTGGGLQRVHAVDVGLLDHPAQDRYAREHFGFADGFSQPAIRGSAGPETRAGMGTPEPRGRWRPVEPGEFVLGYPGEDGLPAHSPPAPLAMSGSFLVVRKLEQDVAAFRRYLREAAKRLFPRLPKDADARARALRARQMELAAKMVGRWPDGRSLAVSGDPVGSPEDLGPHRINDFRYARDPHGFGCPLGAHTRRANPRDGFGWDGRPTKRHRVIRRSMPYGPPAYDPTVPFDAPGGFFDPEVPDDGHERGLMFACYQADIERQFEVVQGRWLNSGDPFWLGEERDFLTIGPNLGRAGAGKGQMTIQGAPPKFMRPQPSFVRTRGGEYFFAPGLAALRALASAYWR
jgi:Dyp-type peroxidase family